MASRGKVAGILKSPIFEAGILERMDKRTVFTHSHALVATLVFALAALMCLFLGACTTPGGGASTQSVAAVSSTSQEPSSSSVEEHEMAVEEDGWYNSKEEVALYLHEYGHLPGNYISKNKARKAGWVASKGNLDEVCPGMSIGGSEFYNDEGTLPDARGRTWTECDIAYEGGYRGPERIVFSNDGLIFYTGDHYKTFERLY